MTLIRRLLLLLCCAIPAAGSACRPPEHDLVIRHSAILDGSGGPVWSGDVAVQGDTLVAVGPTVPGRGRREIDAGGLAVSPGFINMLSEEEFEHGHVHGPGGHHHHG